MEEITVLDVIESKNPQEIFDYCMERRRLRIQLERRITDLHNEINLLKKNMQTMCGICSRGR